MISPFLSRNKTGIAQENHWHLWKMPSSVLFRRKKNVRPRAKEEKKRERFLLLVVIFLYRTLSSSLVTRAIERTKRVRWTRLPGVTTFMANSRKNDRPNKLLAHAIKKKAYGVRGFRWRGETRTKKEERRSTERAERYRSRGEFGKVDGRYYGAGVKNERDIKKNHPRSLLSALAIGVGGSATW